MKNLLLTIFLIPAICFSQNRVITTKDTALFDNEVVIGDLILEKPTNGVPFADGINQLRYTSISKTFPTLREGGTIWIDGTKIGPLCEIRLLNVNETTPWSITTASVRPLPGTRVNCIYTKNSYGGFLYLIQGLKNLNINGENEAYPGINGLIGKEFLKGRFGFGATSTGYYGGYHAYSLSVLDGGKLTIKGFEGEHGFSILRLNGGSYDWTVQLEISNFYIHDSGSEGMYLGATHGAPYAKLKDLQIHDGIIVRSGSESLQLQHLVGRAWIHNVSMVSCDAGYLNEFQPFQDTGMQTSPDEGDILIENLVIDAWGSHGLNCFGAPYDSPNKRIRFKKILMNNGRGEAIYIHPSTKYGMSWEFDSLWILNLNDDYYINNKAYNPAWIISQVNGTDKFTFTNVLYKDQPAVQYVNPGFTETADKVKFYSRYYAKYISGLDTLAVKYKAGEILEDREDLKEPIFVKVINDFTASSIRPKNNHNCQVLTWDSNTVRSDNSTWNKDLKQFNYPPDDYRVKYNNFYGLKNMGLVEEKPDLEILVSALEAENKELTDSIKILTDERNAQEQFINSIIDENTNYVKTINDLKLKIEAIKNDLQVLNDKYK